MNRIMQNIRAMSMVKAGDVVGVAVSGGRDSMALLHYLNEVKEDLDIEIVSINIDHCIRAQSENDSRFVAEYCKENKIRNYKFTIDSLKIARERKMSIEQAAREGRYEAFRSLIKKGIVDKIALAHHLNDQAETILMHILRGSGLHGASGMGYISEKGFIRPMRDVPRGKIDEYIQENDIMYVEDETNADSSYMRNFVRNEVLPVIAKRWPSAVETISNFGNICKQDDDYINSLVDFDAVWIDKAKGLVRMPRNYFIYPVSVVSRMIKKAFEALDIFADNEYKHINMIIDLANKSENGSKISLPNKVTVYNEYDYVTIEHKKPKVSKAKWAFGMGKKKIDGVGELIVRKSKTKDKEEGKLKIDAGKLPKGIVWRFREDGDTIVKFGGFNKKVKSLLNEKKVPSRLRDNLPMLAIGSEVFVVAGVEISDKLKIDETTKAVVEIEFKFI